MSDNSDRHNVATITQAWDNVNILDQFVTDNKKFQEKLLFVSVYTMIAVHVDKKKKSK